MVLHPSCLKLGDALTWICRFAKNWRRRETAEGFGRESADIWDGANIRYPLLLFADFLKGAFYREESRAENRDFRQIGSKYHNT